VNEAVLAINSLNGYQAGSAQLEVKFADADAGPKTPVIPPNALSPIDNLYIRNLPSTWGEAEVVQLFKPYGEVRELRLLNHTEHSGRSVAALVRMSSVAQATAVIEALNGRMIPGGAQPVILRYADSAEDKVKRTHRTNHHHLQVKGSRYSPYPTSGAPSGALGPGGSSGDAHQQESFGGSWPSATPFGGFNSGGGPADMNDMGLIGRNSMGNPLQRMDSGEKLSILLRGCGAQSQGMGGCWV
jgi:hypothetical protein